MDIKLKVQDTTLFALTSTRTYIEESGRMQNPAGDMWKKKMC